MGRIIPYMKWKIKNVPNHQPGWGYYSQVNGQIKKMFLTTKQQGFKKDLRWILQQKKKCWINGGIIINFRLANSKKHVYHAKMKDICYNL